MANIFASAGAGGHNCRLDWTLDFNDVANTLTVNATHTHFDGSVAPDPQQALLTVQLSNNADVVLDLLTGLLDSGQAFDGTATEIINSGPRTRTNVKLKVSANRAADISFSTQYVPPA